MPGVPRRCPEPRAAEPEINVVLRGPVNGGVVRLNLRKFKAHMLKPTRALSLLTLFLLCSGTLVLADDPAPTLEFRLADDAKTPGWQKMELPGSDKPIFVSVDAPLNGALIEKVSFYKDVNGNPSVGFTLTDDGAKDMEATTSRNLNKKLAIVLNGKVVSAPTIRSTITKEVQITGRFDKDDLLAFFRAIVLRESP